MENALPSQASTATLLCKAAARGSMRRCAGEEAPPEGGPALGVATLRRAQHGVATPLAARGTLSTVPLLVSFLKQIFPVYRR